MKTRVIRRPSGNPPADHCDGLLLRHDWRVGIERDGKILIFKTPEEVELFIDIENRNIEEQLTESEPVNIIKPVEVIDKVEIKQLSKAYGYQRKLYHADKVGNIERVIAIYKELQQLEEDDIEILLIHT